ncbi:MAG: Phosphomannomutase/phosphoglucomutase [Firmicutes bacterium ADurb.Bin300]|nr:MAG: Phosphomannomutase/phosphoglucomutase [Firmicutes bacterium ADurb.Bin300]
MDIMKLKSGSDIRGIGFSEKRDEIELTDSLVSSVTAAFVCFLHKELRIKNPVVSVGMDSRLSSKRISRVVIETLLSFGIKTFDCGLSSTPAMFMTTVNLGCDAAVMITASHMPYKMNGLKFFSRQGGFSAGDIEIILIQARDNPFTPVKTDKKEQKSDHMELYCESLREMIKEGVKAKNYETPLSGLKIAVDAGNGVGGFYADKVLAPLGADCSASRYLEPDGHFPNHIPNPEDKTAMHSIRQAVLESNSDFGIIFDTDVDRAACVDSSGKEINRNRLIALASTIALREFPGGTVVTDSVTSDGLSVFITENLGGVHRRFKRGYKNVIDEAKRLQSEGTLAPLAIETSGHAAFGVNYYLDDGAYLITRIVIELANMKKKGKEPASLISGLREPIEEKETRYLIQYEDFKSYGVDVISRFEQYASKNNCVTICPDNYEGIRVSFDKSSGNGWLLLRMSLHEPLLVMNCESDEKGGINKIMEFFNEFINGFDKIKIR